jgi:hypothetical protein
MGCLSSKNPAEKPNYTRHYEALAYVQTRFEVTLGEFFRATHGAYRYWYASTYFTGFLFPFMLIQRSCTYVPFFKRHNLEARRRLVEKPLITNIPAGETIFL